MKVDQKMDRDKQAKKLAYELTYHKFLLNRDKAHSLFTEVDVAEYIALHLIARTAAAHSGVSQPTYLTELAEKLEMPLSGVSKMVTKLKDRGLVLWSHAGNGSEGTFVSITESGFAAMERQDGILEGYYGQVVERFGRENLVRLLKQLDDLERIMNEVDAMEGDNGYGSDEA